MRQKMHAVSGAWPSLISREPEKQSEHPLACRVCVCLGTRLEAGTGLVPTRCRGMLERTATARARTRSCLRCGDGGIRKTCTQSPPPQRRRYRSANPAAFFRLPGLNTRTSDTVALAASVVTVRSFLDYLRKIDSAVI